MSRNKISQIYETVKRINRVYEVWAGKHGLTLYEMQIYYVIWEREKHKITQKELSKQLDAPKTSINSIIKKQLKTGRIEMSVNPLNKREKIIVLTKEGETFAKESICPLFQYEEEAASEFSDNEWEIAMNTQTKFANILWDKMNVKP